MTETATEVGIIVK